MAKIGIFMGIICLGVIGRIGVLSDRSLIHPSSRTEGRDLLEMYSPRDFSSLRFPRNDVLKVAKAEVGVKEVGNNDGKRIREYLAYTGIKQPAAWCASYVSFVFHKAGYTQPKSAWSPALFPASRIVKGPKPADVFGVWFPELKRIAHVGIVAEIRGDWVYSIEGNSSPDGSRNGDGVYERLRHRRTVYRYADWISTQ